MLVASFVLLPFALVLYGAAPTPLAATGALVVLGASYMFVLSGTGTTVQLRAPQALRGRVLSIYFLALGVLYPIGAQIQGPIADHVGMGRVTVVAGAVLLLAVAGLVARHPARVRAMGDPVEPPPSVPVA